MRGLFQLNKDSAAGGVYLPIIYHLKVYLVTPKSNKFARKLPNFDTFSKIPRNTTTKNQNPENCQFISHLLGVLLSEKC